jgi:hypothetical protein
MLDRVLRQGSEPGAALELLIGGAAAKLIAQRLGSIHDQSLELADCLRASDHGTLTSSGQYPQGLAVTAGPRCGQVFPAEGFAGGADRVQVIGLCTVATRRTGGSIDLDHPFAVLEQRCGEPGAVTSRALDGPHPALGCLLVSERAEPAVAERVCGDGDLIDHASRPGVNNGGGVRVAVGVDTDDEVDDTCEHGAHGASFP